MGERRAAAARQSDDEAMAAAMMDGDDAQGHEGLREGIGVSAGQVATSEGSGREGLSPEEGLLMTPWL